VLTAAGADQEDSHRASLVAAAATEATRVSYASAMDEARFQQWLDAYVGAWRTYEKDEIDALFSEDVSYRYHPWDEPIVGRAALVENWLEDRDDPESWTAQYRPWVVAGDQAVAVGVSRYLSDDRVRVEREYHNVFLCRFDADDRCSEFTEIFLRRTG
jgi:ketosteroid isomerase-like protein